MFHHHPVWLSLGGGPGGPTNETADRVAPLRLVQWELVATTRELIAPILQPVRPRDQHLAPARGTHLIGAISAVNLARRNHFLLEGRVSLPSARVQRVVFAAEPGMPSRSPAGIRPAGSRGQDSGQSSEVGLPSPRQQGYHRCGDDALSASLSRLLLVLGVE